jgi:hypothetical protein
MSVLRIEGTEGSEGSEGAEGTHICVTSYS